MTICRAKTVTNASEPRHSLSPTLVGLDTHVGYAQQSSERAPNVQTAKFKDIHSTQARDQERLIQLVGKLQWHHKGIRWRRTKHVDDDINGSTRLRIAGVLYTKISHFSAKISQSLISSVQHQRLQSMVLRQVLGQRTRFLNEFNLWLLCEPWGQLH